MEFCSYPNAFLVREERYSYKTKAAHFVTMCVTPFAVIITAKLDKKTFLKILVAL